MQSYKKYSYAQGILKNICMFSTQKPNSQLPIFQQLTNPDKNIFTIFATVKRIVLTLLCIAACLPLFSQKKKQLERFPM